MKEIRNIAIFFVMLILLFKFVERLKEQEISTGEIVYRACVKDGKTDTALAIQIMEKSGDTFYFKILFSQGLCKDRKEEIKKGDLVRVDYASLKGRFVTVYRIIVNNKDVIETRGFENWNP